MVTMLSTSGAATGEATVKLMERATSATKSAENFMMMAMVGEGTMGD